MPQRTLVMIKPDGVRRGLIGEIVARLEAKGFRIVGMKMFQMTPEMADRHYAEHVGKDFYPTLLRFILSGPAVAMVVEGFQAIHLVRMLMGATKTINALPGTIRGDFGCHDTQNLIHGSDSPEKAQYEIDLYFKPEELYEVPTLPRDP